MAFMRLMLSFVNYFLLSTAVISFTSVSVVPSYSEMVSAASATAGIPIIAQKPASLKAEIKQFPVQDTNRDVSNSRPDLSYLKAVQNHWAKIFIQGLADRNLISKSENFEPDRKITRAEFAVILDRSFPFQPTVRSAIAFNDVPANFWAAEAIQSAYSKGFMVGNLGSFRPNEYIKRSQAMVAIANGLGVPRNSITNSLKNSLVNSLSNSQLDPKILDPKILLFSMYTDASLIPDWAIASIAALTDKQIVVNYPNVQKVNPNSFITKAELSALIYQSLVYTGQLPKINSNFIPSPNTRLFNATDFTSKEIITHLKVSLSKRLVVAYQGNKKLKTYPIGVGRAGWETPLGSYRAVQIIRNPAWKNPFTGDVIKANDPDNPLGGYWIGFWTNGKDWSGFHATSQRDSVGKASSHGCLRMYKEDIRAIFARVTPATIVQISR